MWLTYQTDDDIDIDVDEGLIPTVQERHAAAEPACDSDLTQFQAEVLRREDDANDRALRYITTDDCYTFAWSKDRTTFLGRRETFTGTSRPTFEVTDQTRAIDVFDKIFDADFIDHLCVETNRNAEQKIALMREQNKIAPHSRFHRWFPTDRDEMVLCTLSYLANGSYQRPEGVIHIRQVVEALNSNYMLKNIQTQQERSRIRQEFQRKFNLPGVIGCIDCTHIAIVKPHHDEHQFFNRKGYHSLNVQMICDNNLKILNVIAKFGGATYDSFIWASSQVERYMRELHQRGEQTWLLGDSGYPQRSWLMTPVLNAALGSRAEVYTRRHVQARNCIERCFGVLKARWRCVHKDRVSHLASKIVIACCVLHNIALKARLPPPVDTEEQHDSANNEAWQDGPAFPSSQEETAKNDTPSRLAQGGRRHG
uniref:SFRICE_023918 n=1 Tax=Spodoptera frugiperda TaxID=7108 RepID=A0A2H1W5I3_SPOFR